MPCSNLPCQTHLGYGEALKNALFAGKKVTECGSSPLLPKPAALSHEIRIGWDDWLRAVLGSRTRHDSPGTLGAAFPWASQGLAPLSEVPCAEAFPRRGSRFNTLHRKRGGTNRGFFPRLPALAPDTRVVLSAWGSWG